MTIRAQRMHRFCSRLGRHLLAAFITAASCGTGWAVPMLTLPGNPPGDLFTKVLQPDCMDRTGTRVLASVCFDTAFVANQLATSTTTFMSPGSFNGTDPTTQTIVTDFNNWN